MQRKATNSFNNGLQALSDAEEYITQRYRDSPNDSRETEGAGAESIHHGKHLVSKTIECERTENAVQGDRHEIMEGQDTNRDGSISYSKSAAKVQQNTNILKAPQRLVRNARDISTECMRKSDGEISFEPSSALCEDCDCRSMSKQAMGTELENLDLEATDGAATLRDVDDFSCKDGKNPQRRDKCDDQGEAHRVNILENTHDSRLVDTLWASADENIKTLLDHDAKKKTPCQRARVSPDKDSVALFGRYIKTNADEIFYQARCLGQISTVTNKRKESKTSLQQKTPRAQSQAAHDVSKRTGTVKTVKVRDDLTATDGRKDKPHKKNKGSQRNFIDNIEMEAFSVKDRASVAELLKKLGIKRTKRIAGVTVLGEVMDRLDKISRSTGSRTHTRLAAYKRLRYGEGNKEGNVSAIFMNDYGNEEHTDGDVYEDTQTPWRVGRSNSKHS